MLHPTAHLAQRQIAQKRGAVNTGSLVDEHRQLCHEKLEHADLLMRMSDVLSAEEAQG